MCSGNIVDRGEHKIAPNRTQQVRDATPPAEPAVVEALVKGNA
jgi:hypothetical protein